MCVLTLIHYRIKKFLYFQSNPWCSGSTSLFVKDLEIFFQEVAETTDALEGRAFTLEDKNYTQKI